MLTYILFIIGFIFLVKGADLLVDGSSSIAKKFGISDLVIGLTIVALGTSAPELFVNIVASLKGSSDIAIGNIIGSNIANILLILGIAAIIYPLSVTRGTAMKEVPLNLLAILLLFIMANDALIDKVESSLLTRIDGLVLLSFFIIFIYYTFGIAKIKGKERDNVKRHTFSISLLFIIAGAIGLALGGKWVVDGALMIAHRFGLSESLMGLTIIAIGTSLPELATSAVAAFKKSADIAIGNVVGSNIFNIFYVLGLSSIINPIPLNLINNTDIIVCIGATFMLFVYIFIGKKHVIERWQGITFVSIYIAYIAFLILRG